ncbi:MAG: adenylyl-sulfate kinase [Deltaproteobacteria bacterium]|nr:adenylyl-sulfate kinase [Deltaproteobacteria bacterium]
MNGYVVWLTGDRVRMDALAEALRTGLAGTARTIDVFTAEMVEDKLCAHEARSADFRDVVVRRLAWLCRVLARNGGAAVAVAASPRRAVRDEAHRDIDRFLEVLVHGTMPDGYEPPPEPAVEARASDSSFAVVEAVRRALAERGLVAQAPRVYTPEEEARVRERLERLGYG